MPNVNGLVFLEALRRINDRVPVLVVSGASADELPLAQIEALDASFLAKPFNKTDLITAVHQCCTQARVETNA
jgi:FixJ family two-component response regulator